jgi:membrane protein implicated in regulation of membrane protease activity
MIAGQMVSVQNSTTKRWDKRGIIVKACNPRNRTFQVKVDGTIWTRSKIFFVQYISCLQTQLAR